MKQPSGGGRRWHSDENQRLRVGKWLVWEHIDSKWLNWNRCLAMYLSCFKWNFLITPCDAGNIKERHVYISLDISQSQTIICILLCRFHVNFICLLSLMWNKLPLWLNWWFLSVYKNTSCEKSFFQFLSNYPVWLFCFLLWFWLLWW